VEHVRLNVMSYINDQFSRAQRPKTIKRVQFEETAQSDRPDDREKEISRKKSRASRGKTAENDFLYSLVKGLMGTEPMSTDDILNKLTKRGWSTTRANPKQLVYQQLQHLLRNNEIQKAGRGQFIKV